VWTFNRIKPHSTLIIYLISNQIAPILTDVITWIVVITPWSRLHSIIIILALEGLLNRLLYQWRIIANLCHALPNFFNRGSLIFNVSVLHMRWILLYFNLTIFSYRARILLYVLGCSLSYRCRVLIFLRLYFISTCWLTYVSLIKKIAVSEALQKLRSSLYDPLILDPLCCNRVLLLCGRVKWSLLEGWDSSILSIEDTFICLIFIGSTFVPSLILSSEMLFANAML
jgi:hypothetical protein